ncbi:MAG: DUF3604 domain-containing protein, partial [Henriciella sp.]
MRWYHLTGLIILLVAVIGYIVFQNRLSAPLISDEDILQMQADAASEDETRFPVPTSRSTAGDIAAINPLKNVYFGELHIHTDQSFDSYIFGNRLTPDQAYQFAKGEPVLSPVGQAVQLAVPLDFTAVTDHAEGFMLNKACEDPNAGADMRALCAEMQQPNFNLFMRMRTAGEQRPPASLAETSPEEAAQAIIYAQETWAEIVAAADNHNDPGRFTTFAGYEYSPPLPARGKIHRNIIFRNSSVPRTAVSAFDALTEIDLWAQLKDSCQAPCEFITIPHNPNKTWGLAFANHTIDGDEYTEADWRQRDQFEPLVEMYQIKGNSECAIGVGSTDEECGFEQFLPRCEDGQTIGCITPTSMARNGLKIGLELENEIGFNPLDFGMIGATDSHNSTPGDTEEWDYRGSSGYLTATALRRLSAGPGGNYLNLINNPGGLAAIWAPENTRDALFDAMQRKEVYATSGTRIRLRMFGSFDFNAGLPEQADLLEIAYRDGVPMGGRLAPRSDRSPDFLVWALQDPINAPLDRIQIIKGWTENGETFETVYDIVCSNGRSVDPDTKRCPEIQASVDISNCTIDPDAGEPELKTLWSDPDYGPGQNAFYYARTIQTPTCRWSTYDSLRLGQTPSERVPATISEMAWSSPIWIN